MSNVTQAKAEPEHEPCHTSHAPQRMSTHRKGKLFCLHEAFQDAQVVSEPAHAQACHRHGTWKGI